MNKAITDGLVFTPPQFANGLDVWSRGDGTPGSATYDGYANAAFVPADQDFGGCLEILKVNSAETLRYMGETPVVPGCYLQIKARVKAISGNLPSVRIAGYAAKADGSAVPGVTLLGTSTTLESYGTIVEITAIVGNGARQGVDMSWGSEAVYGHFGLDITGSTGGVIRIDDISIEDVTSAFHRDMMDWVDVKDFGAIGDGTTDNIAAFEAADAAADGRGVLVSDGVYALNDNMVFSSRVRFEGTVTMPTEYYLGLKQNFDFDTYAAAFGDEVLGFKKAFQALLERADHESLDLCGRIISLDAPIDMVATVPGRTTYQIRRVIRNGQFDAVPSTDWDDGVITSTATYSASNNFQLTNVQNAANIEIGSLLEGAGVGREVYVRDVDVAAQTIDLSRPLYGAEGTQTFIFKRFRYMLDFSGFDRITQMGFQGIDFKCDGEASAVMMAKDGVNWLFNHNYFNKPKDRGITSIGRACQGMEIESCNFISNESPIDAGSRTSIAFNTNANDAKVRDNRGSKFGHWAVVSGSGHNFQGNHFFSGDGNAASTRQAGLVITDAQPKITLLGNYIDNCFVEWTNEHDSSPDQNTDLSFGGLTIVGNIFFASTIGSWFRSIVIKPYGSGHFINGLNVTGNTFKVINGSIDRVDAIDDSIATLDFSRIRNVEWTGNTYHAIDQWTMNPVMLSKDQNTAASTWSCDFSEWLPFGGRVRNITSVVADGPLKNGSNGTEYVTCWAEGGQGSDGGTVHLNWPVAVSGAVNVTARMDNPF